MGRGGTEVTYLVLAGEGLPLSMYSRGDRRGYSYSVLLGEGGLPLDNTQGVRLPLYLPFLSPQAGRRTTLSVLLPTKDLGPEIKGTSPPEWTWDQRLEKWSILG